VKDKYADNSHMLSRDVQMYTRPQMDLLTFWASTDRSGHKLASSCRWGHGYTWWKSWFACVQWVPIISCNFIWMELFLSLAIHQQHV